MKGIIALIPARGGSKRVLNKNIVDLVGKPLLWYTIQAAKKSRYVSEIYVSTEDKRIKKLAEKFGARVINRPKFLARDKASSLSVLKHAVDFFEKNGASFRTLVFLQPTSPLRQSKTIDKAIKKFIDLKAEALYSLVKSEVSHNWLITLNKNRVVFSKNIDFKNARTQDQKSYYRVNGAIYIFSRKCIKESIDYAYSKNNSYIIMNRIESIDIDSHQDLKIVEVLLRNKKIKLYD